MTQASTAESAMSVSSLHRSKLGMWLFLATEVMFFAALIGAYVLLRVTTPDWPAPYEVFNIPLITLNTFLLIMSSYMVVRALSSAQRDDQRNLLKFLLLTLLFGTTFLTVQGYEYYELWHHGITPMADAFGATFYVITGFHGFHVFIGVLWLLVVIWQAYKGDFGPHNYYGIEFFGLYWHFVDLVWIILFAIIYLV